MGAASKSKVYYAQTSDGWKIALHRHHGDARRFPVLLVHGLASNYRNMDFPLQDLSLARFLRGQGFDSWIIDLRGSGLSKKGKSTPYRWYFDDFVFQDLPAAVDLVLQETGAKKFHWIGHSLGGLLAYPFCQTFHMKNSVQSLTTIAAPMTTRSKPGYFKHLYRLDALLKILPRLPYKSLSRIASRFINPILGMNDHVLFARDNMTEEILKSVLQHTVESVPSSLILQIHDWFRHNYFSSRDGKVNFMENLEDMTMPILMIIGSIDSFTPLSDIRLAFRKIPNAEKTLLIFGKDKGHQTEYGHIDLILGKHAPREVFPQILNFLISSDHPKKNFKQTQGAESLG